MLLLDFPDLLVVNGLGIERHFPQFVELGPGLAAIDLEGGLARLGSPAAACVVDDIKGRFGAGLSLCLHQ